MRRDLLAALAALALFYVPAQGARAQTEGGGADEAGTAASAAPVVDVDLSPRGLSRRVAVENIVVSPLGTNLKRVDAEVRNKSRSDLTLDYRVEWRTAQGAVAPGLQAWQTLFVPASSSVPMRAVSLRPEAVNATIILREVE